jgi:hypothetical protein
MLDKYQKLLKQTPLKKRLFLICCPSSGAILASVFWSRIDSEGNILVHALTEKDENSTDYFDVFNPQGDFIASVQIIGDIKFPSDPWTYFAADCFW